MKIDFLTPKFPKFFNVKRYLGKAYVNNIFTNEGPILKELEKRFKDVFECKDEVVFVANGTLALIIAYKYIGCKKALLPSFTFPATVQACHWAGIDYEFVDIHPTKWTLNIDDLEDKIHKYKADLIIGVHSFGNPCDVQAIQALAAINNCKVIYDAAPAISSFIEEELPNGTKNAVHVSKFGDMSTFSLHATKALQAAEGGVIFIKDKQLAETVRRSINFGFDDNRVPTDPFGQNAKLSEIHASIAVCSLERLAFNQKDRLEMVDLYKSNLSGVVEFQEIERGSISTHQVFSVLLPKKFNRDNVIMDMQRKGIQCRKYYTPPLHKVECFKRNYSLPVTEDICERIITLPLHLWMEKDHVRAVANTLKEVLGDMNG